jgi:hypothetical protein
MSAHRLTRLADAALVACDFADPTEFHTIRNLAQLKQIAQKKKRDARHIYAILEGMRLENARLHAEGASQETIDKALEEPNVKAINAVLLAGEHDEDGEMIQLSQNAIDRIVQIPPTASHLEELAIDTIQCGVRDSETMANLYRLARISTTNPLAAANIYVLITRLATAKSRLDRAVQEMYYNNQREMTFLNPEILAAQHEMQESASDILRQGAAEIIRAVHAADRFVALRPETLRQIVQTLVTPVEWNH